jgi:hypothetical protein
MREKGIIKHAADKLKYVLHRNKAGGFLLVYIKNTGRSVSGRHSVFNNIPKRRYFYYGIQK